MAGRARPSTTARGLGYAWQQLTKRAFAHYGRACHLRYKGCTRYADTIDHLDSRMLHGPAIPTLDRVRPACRHCNTVKSNKLRAAVRQARRAAQPSGPLRQVARRRLL